MLGLKLTYASLIGCAVLLGLANSVYHPADYAILSAHMDEARMGRAFSIHTFAGFLGGAVAPAIVAALVTSIGGIGALIVCGAAGPLTALLLLIGNVPEAGPFGHRADGDGATRASIITPALMLLTVFFMLLSLSNAGISNFGVVALMNGYGTSFSIANVALTAYLGASAAGVLAGGVLADRTNTRWGKFRPWILFTAVPWVIVMILAYTTPNGWSMGALIAYAVITNTLLMTIYSMNNVP